LDSRLLPIIPFVTYCFFGLLFAPHINKPANQLHIVFIFSDYSVLAIHQAIYLSADSKRSWKVIVFQKHLAILQAVEKVYR
jgi:hypothetical protein